MSRAGHLSLSESMFTVDERRRMKLTSAQPGKEKEAAWHRGCQVAHCRSENRCKHRPDFLGTVDFTVLFNDPSNIPYRVREDSTRL